MKSYRLLALLAVVLTVPFGSTAFAADPPTPMAPIPVHDEATTGGYLGVLLDQVPDATRAQLGAVLPPGQGVMIADVMAGSPAAKAGLKVFDILLYFGDQKLFSAEQLGRLVRAYSPNTTISLQYVRGGVAHEARVTLGRATSVAEAEHPASRMLRMPTLRQQIRPYLPPSLSGRPKWESFYSLSLKKLEDGNFKADIQYFGEDGKLVKQTFSGSRDGIREQIMRQKDLPPAEREQLLDALSARDGFLSPGDMFAPLLYMPSWFNWPADL